MGSEKQPEPVAAFECHISNNKSGFLAGGDGATIKIEIPESEEEEIAKLYLNGRHKILNVVVFDAKDTSPNTTRQTRPRRKR